MCENYKSLSGAKFKILTYYMIYQNGYIFISYRNQ